MNKLYIVASLAAGLFLTSCSSENPFGGNEGEGQLLKAALAVDIDVDDVVRNNAATRADAELDDFKVVFSREGDSQPTAKYSYGDMPEIVTLPAGKYTCTATYGENRPAEWESPYFLGKSETFDIRAFEITSYIEPIICSLENIKVTVDFDATLRNAMSDDSFVEVKVGGSSALNYGIGEADSQKAGYYMYSDELTLVAVFNGTVDGANLVETKSLKNIQKGNHYKIKFTLHQGPGSDPVGDANTDVAVDASVTVVDVARNISLGSESLLDEEGDRPTEGGGEVNPPNPPVNNPPTIIGQSPLNLDGINDGASISSCVINVHSSAQGGFQSLTCDIISEKLTPEELATMLLSDHLDLVNTPSEMQEMLTNLGFPVCVGGKSDATFDITPFLGVLGALGQCEHHFVLTVTDANGTTSKTLKIKY